MLMRDLYSILRITFSSRHLNSIKLVASDCDGVLTDGGLYYTEKIGEFKRFHVYDGMGFLALQKIGIKTAIITGESSSIIDMRAHKLEVNYVIKGTTNKLQALEELCRFNGITLTECAYIGDDTFDMEAIAKSGFGCAPNNALPCVKKVADYVTRKSGGEGAFREMAEIIIERRRLP